MKSLSQRTRTSRTQHSCIWCPEPILPGEKYIGEVLAEGDDFFCNRFHPECKAACEEVAYDFGGECEIYPHECKRGTTEHV